ncbi:MAG: gliding motility protein MglA [Polyangiaceae bacterium]|jgi:signal recognition particle receptor subunit beta|nr:gliding motility protein MglA [Polyangiaceae bacterium]
MASFDSERKCHVVRIVYDGPGFAGKTTNLKRVHEIIPPSRRSEIVTPAELKGRTMFFDWLEIEGPRQGGVGLYFQLITVPGQIERNYRRRPLVAMADVVVFVCDSSPGAIADTQRTFARLRASIKRRTEPVSLIVQANKQDVEGALTPAVLRRKLRLDGSIPMISSNAANGDGVRATLNEAMRVGVRALKGAELTPLLAEFANADNLFDHVLTFEDAPLEGPVEVEEVNVRAEDIDMETPDMAAHLGASSLDALEARARRAAARSGLHPLESPADGAESADGASRP